MKGRNRKKLSRESIVNEIIISFDSKFFVFRVIVNGRSLFIKKLKRPKTEVVHRYRVVAKEKQNSTINYSS